MTVNLNRNIIFILDLKNSELINLPIKINEYSEDNKWSS